MTQLAEELAANGHEITVITSMPHYSTNRIWDEYRGKLWIKNEENGLTVHRVYLHVPEQKTNLLGRLFGYISFNLFSLIAALRVGKHDAVFVPSPPLTNGLTGYIVKLAHRCKFIYNVQDIYPDVAVKLGILTNPRTIRLFEKLERFVYKKADAVSVISHGFWHNLRRKQVPESKLELIPNFVDADFIVPLPRHNDFSTREQLDERFVVLFAGNVGLSQALDKVLETAALLVSQPEILFLIVGNGSNKDFLQQKAKEMQLDNVRFLPFQPHEDVPNMYASADVCIVPLQKGLSQESVPSKAYSILSAGKPLIASVDGQNDLINLLQESEGGMAVESENAHEMAQAIEQLFHNPNLAKTLGESGRRYVVQHCTKQTIARQYEQLFSKLVAPVADTPHVNVAEQEKTDRLLTAPPTHFSDNISPVANQKIL